MSGITAAGEQQACGGNERSKEDRSVDLNPERHNSKADSGEGVTSSEHSQVASGRITDGVADTDWDQHASPHNASMLHSLGDAIAKTHLHTVESKQHSPALHIDTGTPSSAASSKSRGPPLIFETPVTESAPLQPSLMSPTIPIATSSLRSNLSTSSMASTVSGTSSALNSPYLAAMSDLTPLPSPRSSTDLSRSGSWRKSFGRPSTPRSRGTSLDEADSSGVPTPQPTSPYSSAKKRKGYGSLLQDAVEANAVAAEENSKSGAERHGRDRSISDFVPEHLSNFRQRHVTFGPGAAADIEAQEHKMHREAYLATKRGLTSTDDAKKQHQLPSPPRSSSSVGESDEADDREPDIEDGISVDYLVIHCGMHNKRRKFRQIRQLGQGTFSKVMLATRERIPAHHTPEIEEHLDPRKLVAVKIVEQGPAGGADEQRIEIGLKREVEMLKSLSHPSLVHLKACEYQASRALLVLSYCPGGDLFEFASQKRDLLTPLLIQRIFSELLHAVRYLHSNWIVHRDIKLENVLVNLPSHKLQTIQDPRLHPTPIVTLTDLGLSRRIPEPPELPLLTTRCGSEDYAAPEILLGQPYDGRLTDAWALGVLLYALMEGRLPFDAPPGKPERSRNTHRIARCDWIWCRFGDDDGDWDLNSGVEFDSARSCVEGLLKKANRGRKSLGEIEYYHWVQDGIQVPGGLKQRAEDEDNALL